MNKLYESDWSTKYHYWDTDIDINNFDILSSLYKKDFEKIYDYFNNKKYKRYGKERTLDEVILERYYCNCYTELFSQTDKKKLDKTFEVINTESSKRQNLNYIDFELKSGSEEYFESVKKYLINKFTYDVICTKINGKSRLDKEGNFIVYRTIGLDEIQNFDKTDLGVCWTYNQDNVEESWWFGTDNSYKAILKAHISKDNIDWLESIFLAIIYGVSEQELRIIDPNKIHLDYFKIIDNDNGNIIHEEGTY